MFQILLISNPQPEIMDKSYVEKYLNGDMSLKEMPQFAKKFNRRLGFIIHVLQNKFNDRFLSIKFNYGKRMPPKYQSGNEDYFMEQALHYEDIKENIQVKIEAIQGFPVPHYENKYHSMIPTHWLYDDFTDELNEYYELKLKEANQFDYKNKLKTYKIKELQESVKSKLTREELKVISFKMPLEVAFEDLDIKEE